MAETMINLDKILPRVTRPARYTGGEWNSVSKDWQDTPLRFALAYPDIYEIGMSNMALPILYEILNDQPDALAERVFAPWVDMAKALRENSLPLFSLESRRPLKDFDVIGFSLGYELTYTNVLNMLDLAQLPVLAAERDDTHPLVIAGGSCALNPEPMADFIDFFVLGDGEEVILELTDYLRDWKKEAKKAPREALLRRVATIPGIYVPGLYQVEYRADGAVKGITPLAPEASPTVKRRIAEKLPPPVTRPVVPFIETVHDRGAIEIQRGCSHGCRFCHAGTIYRPLRTRPQAEIVEAVDEIIENCGYGEVALVSLSTGDYPDIDKLVAELSRRYPDLALSLPSLYVNQHSIELIDSLPGGKKTGLTLAPEAGSESLRRSINKNISDEELLETATTAFERGWTGIKLYFMLGLPGETAEDIAATINLIKRVQALGRQVKGRPPQIRITLATFVPKPHTPFQWVAQESSETLNARQDMLRQGLPRKGVRLSWQDPEVSLLEAALSRGDRRTGRAIYNAWKLGSAFDSWGEHFKFGNWQRAFETAGLSFDFYARRQRPLDEVLPWSHIDTGISPEFLKREYRRSLEQRKTTDCRNERCNACGLEHSYPACQQKLAQAAG